MRTAHVGAALVIIVLPAFASAAVATAQGNEADLAVTIQFVGHGKAKAKLGQQVTLAVTVANDGPATAQGVSLLGSGSDHFNVVSTTCGEDTSTSGETSCPDVASGEAVSGTVVLQVCCFPVGETRHAFGDVSVSSSTTDPNESNNFASTDIRIIGRHNPNG